jgi:hypothetical protein
MSEIFEILALVEKKQPLTGLKVRLSFRRLNRARIGVRRLSRAASPSGLMAFRSNLRPRCKFRE